MGISVMKEGAMIGRGLAPVVAPSRVHRDPEAVVILGAGPAGLLAAHAVALAGREPVIFSAPEPLTNEPLKSQVGAATYLHSAIPDLTSAEPDDSITFEKIGTRAGYALKVYGDKDARCSWEKFHGTHPAWALQPAYDDLWVRYSDRIVPQQVNAALVRDMIDSFPLVISTIHAMAICEAGHSFPSRPIWVTDESLEMPDQMILYDGRVGTVGDRYRSSRVFGCDSTEYAREVPGSRSGIKVQPTDCDCFAGDVVRAGRWGEWKPGVLVDHAFQKVWTGMFDQFEGA